jgi:hypothetical protein
MNIVVFDGEGVGRSQRAFMVWRKIELPVAKCFDFWLVINEGLPSVGRTMALGLTASVRNGYQEYFLWVNAAGA